MLVKALLFFFNLTVRTQPHTLTYTVKIKLLSQRSQHLSHVNLKNKLKSGAGMVLETEGESRESL